MTVIDLTQPPDLYWHFLPISRLLHYGDGRLVETGQTLRVEGRPHLALHGLHASVRAIDALSYGHGPIACRVTLGGQVAQSSNLLAAQERTCLWMVDATRILQEFASDVAGKSEMAFARAAEHTVAKNTAWDAANAAGSAAHVAAHVSDRDAAWSTVYTDAYAAAYEGFNVRLTQMLLAAGQEGKK